MYTFGHARSCGLGVKANSGAPAAFENNMEREAVICSVFL